MSDIEKAKELIFEFNLVNTDINPFFTFEELKERSLENLYEKLNPILIPAEGPADTLAGELLRAYQHIQYKWVNDEDSPFSGEPSNVIPDFLFIANYSKKADVEGFFKELRETYQNKSAYKEFILGGGLLDYVFEAIFDACWNDAFKHNDKDSRSYFEVDNDFNVCNPDLPNEYGIRYSSGLQDEFAWWCRQQPNRWDIEFDPDYPSEIKLTLK